MNPVLEQSAQAYNETQEFMMKRWMAGLVLAGMTVGAHAAPPVSELSLAKMTLEDKVGQMTQAARGLSVAGRHHSTGWGLVLSGGGAVPKTDNSVDGWRAMISQYQAEALATPLKIPMIYGADAVHGHNNLHDATIFPHNIGLGAAGDADLVFRVRNAPPAEELKATGDSVDVRALRRRGAGSAMGPYLRGLFTRSAAVGFPSGHNGGRCAGFQGDTLGETGVTASVKHFVADGGTDRGIDRGDAKITQAQLEVDLFAAVRSRHSSAPRHHHGVVLEHQRRENAPPTRTC